MTSRLKQVSARRLLLLLLGTAASTAWAQAGGQAPEPEPGFFDALLGLLMQLIIVLKTLFTLSDLLISCWSALLIFVWMVLIKYRRTRPDYTACSLFLLAGVASSIFALYFNWYLAQYTRFSFFEATSRTDTFIAFMLGAGLGEEFWKMSCGLIAAIFIMGLGRRLGDAGRILGFVICGLGFAVMENIITYAPDLGVGDMIRRGLLAVPIHAGMGFIQGVAANATLRRSWPFPLFLGYLAAAAIHTIYDTIPLLIDFGLDRAGAYEVWPDFMAALPSELMVGPIVVLLVLWCRRTWKRTPEGAAGDPALETEAVAWK